MSSISAIRFLIKHAVSVNQSALYGNLIILSGNIGDVKGACLLSQWNAPKICT